MKENRGITAEQFKEIKRNTYPLAENYYVDGEEYFLEEEQGNYICHRFMGNHICFKSVDDNKTVFCSPQSMGTFLPGVASPGMAIVWKPERCEDGHDYRISLQLQEQLEEMLQFPPTVYHAGGGLYIENPQVFEQWLEENLGRPVNFRAACEELWHSNDGSVSVYELPYTRTKHRQTVTIDYTVYYKLYDTYFTLDELIKKFPEEEKFEDALMDSDDVISFRPDRELLDRKIESLRKYGIFVDAIDTSTGYIKIPEIAEPLFNHSETEELYEIALCKKRKEQMLRETPSMEP